MSLLREIQASILDPDAEVGPILLKLRFLASRLGSTQLEEWVKHESEGYPPDVEVPDYRKLRLSFRGTFSGPSGSAIKNAPIPPYLIEKIAGKKWTEHQMRQSITAVDEFAAVEGGTISLDLSNLILLLQGEVYEDYACNSVTGEISKAAMREIQSAVRNRVLELTIELEKAVPVILDVTLAKPVTPDSSAAEAVTQIFNQTIYGHYTAVTSTGAGAQISLNITLNITQGDKEATVHELVKAGIPQKEAEEFVEILASERPESSQTPFGKRAQKWLTQITAKAAAGTWKMGLGVAAKVLEEAAKQYYGLK